ncbi:histidine phosphatase family protein [Pseudaestuariivita atlantica]|uniref:Phosphoglycerate mutase n=1 Tax=Pseudaestuariivita atlantica TaxID=1317121 RepID=A0A0L1JRE5_9RHOB|nr:histidine phosphatase family protein [Pseudaestuariivita atlantica]KNG93943.1 phosphoglycerate mutase [Pseudaestuariivita atlantica]
MARLIVATHPEVVVDPAIPVTDWRLSDAGRARAEALARSDLLRSVGAIWSSTERKARETAAILAAPRGLAVQTDARLGENDRSATGYLPPSRFEAAADAFFAKPERSFRGWETAQAAQERIVTAVRAIVAGHAALDLAIVTHGAVGTLLWCHLRDARIDRAFDQPGQGHLWCADLEGLFPDTGWRPFP